MKHFKDFGITPKIAAFTGDKLKMDRIMNVPIVIHDFKIEDSTAKPGTKRLTLQIERNGSKHILFTGSKVLMQQIEEVDTSGFPFQATIVKSNEYYEFT